MRKPHNSPFSLRPLSLTSCVSKLFYCLIPSRLLFFLKSNSVLSSRQAGFRPRRSTVDQILDLSQCILDQFNKLKLGFPTIHATRDFLKFSALSGIPLSFKNLFQLTLFFALFDGLILFFLIGTFAWFVKITKVAPFESVKVFARICSRP